MTDKEKLIELLKSFDIKFGDIKDSYKQGDNHINFGYNVYNDDSFPKCDKVGGYMGFYTSFEFDEDGKFVTVGAWE